MIPVTKPFLPPREEYNKYVDQIWKNEWLTNMGPLSKDLEIKLAEFLKIESLLFLTNGTVALQMAIKALGLSGEIITTPFSFVATTSSIVWEGCTPIFVDIDPESLNIDPTKIESAITSRTTAILATHVYGNPCDVIAIEAIAKKHKLKVIYDGAHAFGVEINGRSVFSYGDISVCSLHATKLYHSIEGGLITSPDRNILAKLKYIRNFGISGVDSFSELGLNGKNSEFHAAMGLVNLNYINEIHEKRKQICDLYDELLIDYIKDRPLWNRDAERNYAYYPILFPSEYDLLKAMKNLSLSNIQTRRYFYPSLASALPYLEPVVLPITESISKRVLCLPLYYDLDFSDVRIICEIISK